MKSRRVAASMNFKSSPLKWSLKRSTLPYEFADSSHTIETIFCFQYYSVRTMYMIFIGRPLVQFDSIVKNLIKNQNVD